MKAAGKTNYHPLALQAPLGAIAVLRSIVLHSTVLRSTVLRSTAQLSTAQLSTAQLSTAQLSTALFSLLLLGCPSLDSFDGNYEGTVVGSQCSTGPNCAFIRRGFPQGTSLSITDFQAPPTDAPGSITTTPYSAFTRTPLETISPLEHDQLSQLEFPGTDRLRNFIFASRPTDGPLAGRDAMIFLSLLEGDAVEVRVIVGSGDEERGDHFGVFRLERK